MGKILLYVIIACFEILQVDPAAFVKKSEALTDCISTSVHHLSISKRSRLTEVTKWNFTGMTLNTDLEQVVPLNGKHGSPGKKYNRPYLQNNHNSSQSLVLIELPSICPKLKSKPPVSATFKFALSDFANNTWHPPSDIS